MSLTEAKDIPSSAGRPRTGPLRPGAGAGNGAGRREVSYMLTFTLTSMERTGKAIVWKKSRTSPWAAGARPTGSGPLFGSGSVGCAARLLEGFQPAYSEASTCPPPPGE
jgi:hypothetical protein